MDTRVFTRGSPRHFPRRPRATQRTTLSRSFLASGTLHATVLGAGLLVGLWSVAGREPARMHTATFAPPRTPELAAPEREALDPREPEAAAEPELRESEVWSEFPLGHELLEPLEPEPERRSIDWVAARPFAIGTLGSRGEPEPLARESQEPGAHVYHVAPPAEPVLVEPTLLEAPPPDYPRLARRAGEEGSVLCRLALDERGGVVRVEVVESSGFERLDEAARLALATWRFAPRRMNGQAVAAHVLHRVTFQLGPGS